LLASLLRDRTNQASYTDQLSHGQKALWLLHRRFPEGAAYNTAFAVWVRSNVDVSALRAALQTLLDRHVALRTTIVSDQGKLVTRIAAHQELCFTQPDVRGWSLAAIERQVSEDYRRPFDLERGPMLRVGLYTRQDDEHVLLLTLHHIICDAWSMWLLMHELSVLYPACLAGVAAELEPVRVQYPDYVAWQNRLLAGPEGERLWQYWRDRLGGELPVLALATDKVRPATQGSRGASHFFRIDPALRLDLLEVGKAEGATLFMTLLAAFQVLLHRYTGQTDIIVGSPAVGRNNPDVATCFGYFANPLPLRADLSGDPTFRSLLSQVRHTVLDALAHQDMPFSLLIERLQPKRDPSRSPVIEAMFVLQRPPHSEPFLGQLCGEGAGVVRWGGLDVEPFPLPQMEGQFDLTWEAVEGPHGLSCALKYNPDLFEADTIRRMEGHLKTILSSVIEHPEQRVGRLSLLTAFESARLLEEWQGPEVGYPLERCLHHWIEDQVAQSPEAAAVVLDGGGMLSYAGLNQRANQLARHLRRLGVGPDVVVGVLAERSLELVVGLLGILKAGGAYLPLDPDYPPQRLGFMAKDAQIAVLLTHGELFEPAALCAAAAGCAVLRLDADWAEIAGQDRSNPTVEMTAEALAYVIYTSGSTGQPKGVENTHRGICNRLLWMQDAYRLDGADRVLQKTPIGFDVSVWELFWPLMSGATLVLARPGGHRDRDYLVDTIIGHGITTAHFVPSMLRLFLEAEGVAGCRASLRRVVCSGEALALGLQQRFFDRLADVALYNLYGPTEAAVDVTHWTCRNDPALRTVPIGRPIANTRIHLLDAHLQPVPVGVPGELHIGGVGLARGYRNRPELTAAKFIADPLSRRAGDRLYRSGDLCRRLLDGSIEYLQRLDFQVKLRGFRIELGEIEAALQSHPQVREAVVVAHGENEQRQLVGYFVASDPAPPPAALRRHLQMQLPDHMVPATLIPLDALPLTANGKLDRAALPSPDIGRPLLEAAFVAPETVLERRIAALFQEALSIDEVGRHDNFFDLGANSLLLVQIHRRLRDSLEQDLPVISLFQYPTVAALAEQLAGHPSDHASATAQQSSDRAVRRRAASDRRRTASP
jgi:amino acid adenylation domain-containing protein